MDKNGQKWIKMDKNVYLGQFFDIIGHPALHIGNVARCLP
jgi:hypothetical protein